MRRGYDFIQTLNLLTADQYSDALPTGHYSLLHLRISGTAPGATTDAVLGGIKLNIDHPLYKGDVVDISLPNLRIINRAFGGLVETTNAAGGGGAYAYSAFLPFSWLGYPNALQVTPEDSTVLFMEKEVGGAVTTMLCEVVGLFSPSVPENYIPVLSQRRYNTLGGIQATTVRVKNLIALMLKAATTTDPTSVNITSTYGRSMFAPATLRALSDFAFDVDTTALGIGILPLLTGDISDALGDEYSVGFSGGVGNLDYFTLSADIVNGRRNLSRSVQRNNIAANWARADATPVNAGAVPAPQFDPSTATRGVAAS
jgi:hypothetical protein